MASSVLIDVNSSTEVPVTASHTCIPEDIFQAALAASQHDSDGEDPYEPQPKRFMQTEYQKRQHERDLEIKRVARTLKKMREIHKNTRQRVRSEKQHPSPFERLPTDLVLKTMQHTHPLNLLGLINSSVINQQIFRANSNAIFRGMEIEQFAEWKWLFGDSKHRTSAQSQHLKDAILTENRYYNAATYSHGWDYDEQLFGILSMIDNNKFTGMRNVAFLQDMQYRVDLDIKAIESHIRKKIARRTAICLRSLSFYRPSIVNEEDWAEDRSLVDVLELPWEARCQLIHEQPASIRAEICLILKTVVDELRKPLQEVVSQWASRHYSQTGNQRKPQEVKKWMSKLMTGLILETVIPQWHTEIEGSSPAACFVWKSSPPGLILDLEDTLDRHDDGNVDVVQEVQNGVDFGKSIGLDVEDLLERTPVGNYIDMLGRSVTLISEE